MNRTVSIIMYHYVRELKSSRYPEIKGLSLERFDRQLDHIGEHYRVITMEELMKSAQAGSDIPPHAAVLTFDDGYIDHYSNVYPRLRARGYQGSFFPPAKAIMEHEVLDVNKIHFVLASVADKTIITLDIFAYLRRYREEYSLPDHESTYRRLAIPNRFDTGEVIFIKRMLQKRITPPA
jgi:hypothetical protein